MGQGSASPTESPQVRTRLVDEVGVGGGAEGDAGAPQPCLEAPHSPQGHNKGVNTDSVAPRKGQCKPLFDARCLGQAVSAAGTSRRSIVQADGGPANITYSSLHELPAS